MEYISGSNRASNFKLAERRARGRFVITSTINNNNNNNNNNNYNNNNNHIQVLGTFNEVSMFLQVIINKYKKRNIIIISTTCKNYYKVRHRHKNEKEHG